MICMNFAFWQSLGTGFWPVECRRHLELFISLCTVMGQSTYLEGLTGGKETTCIRYWSMTLDLIRMRMCRRLIRTIWEFTQASILNRCLFCAGPNWIRQGRFTRLEQGMKLYIIRQKSICLEEQMMINVRMICTVMTFTRINGRWCLRRVRFLQDEVDQEEFHTRILFISLEGIWRSKISTTQIYLSTICQRIFGSSYQWKELLLPLESITQPIFSKRRSTFLEGLMVTCDMLIFINMILRSIFGVKSLVRVIFHWIDSVIHRWFITILYTLLEDGMEISLWMTFTNTHLKQTCGTTLKSKKEKSLSADTVIQLSSSTLKCISSEVLTHDKQDLMTFIPMT